MFTTIKKRCGDNMEDKNRASDERIFRTSENYYAFHLIQNINLRWISSRRTSENNISVMRLTYFLNTITIP